MYKIFKCALEYNGYTIEDFYNDAINNSDWNNIFQNMFEDDGADGWRIADIIYNRFGAKWKRIYDALYSTYNPIENYNMHEVRTPDLKTAQDTTAKGKTGIYWFNGSGARDSASNDATSSTNQSVPGTETLDRTGNIGVTTSQQMIESEWELRKHDFYQMIYNDIDSLLCLKIY